ncbi:Predicted Dolichyl-phosphate-mannose-protein mannosyltransferase [Ceraceosorus bombacis]|uniref:GPI mannosyltransferase 2 n=1 Tax=Ceraceosorus bombacis TaxID=401625 RepID=A0A0P1BQL7_9BASI|nr:Predicted Dolichyl-phosphate-mannose-protein mannosyltransferase [Ceraceosorus bombacis]
MGMRKRSSDDPDPSVPSRTRTGKDSRDGRSSTFSTQSVERWLLIVAASHRSLSVLLLILFGLLQHPFDASSCVPQSTLATLFTRWDTTHYLTLASPDRRGAEGHSLNGSIGGYGWEHGIAFQPALPWMLRLAGSLPLVIPGQTWSAESAIAITSTLCALSSIACPLLLFRLGRKHTNDEIFSLTAAFLSILTPSPWAQITPTPEAPFACAFLSLCLLLSPSKAEGDGLDPRPSGIKETLEQNNRPVRAARLVLAAVLGAVCSALRANGVLTSGLLLWHILWDGAGGRGGWKLSRLHCLFMLPLVLLPVLPLILVQVWMQQHMCGPSRAQARNGSLSEEARLPPYCSDGPYSFSAYSYVQKRYWNVGPFAYWTIAQSPNLLLAAPILMPMLDCVWTYYSSDWKSSAPHMLVVVHHATLSALLLIIMAHTQISLRLAIALPVVWWGAADWVLQGEEGTTGSKRREFCDAKDQGEAQDDGKSSGLALYAGFYPPA